VDVVGPEGLVVVTVERSRRLTVTAQVHRDEPQIVRKDGKELFAPRETTLRKAMNEKDRTSVLTPGFRNVKGSTRTAGDSVIPSCATVVFAVDFHCFLRFDPELIHK
jgi:hypothetical protein